MWLIIFWEHSIIICLTYIVLGPLLVNVVNILVLTLTVCGGSSWSSSHNGLPCHFGSPSAMESLRQHRQWLVNFRRDICLISSVARYNYSGELVHQVSSGLHSDDQYPLLWPSCGACNNKQTRFTALSPEQPGCANTRTINRSGFLILSSSPLASMPADINGIAHWKWAGKQ